MMKSALFVLVGAAPFLLGLATPAELYGRERAISLFEFGGASGYAPWGGVVTDPLGTVFGTTTIGGTGPCSGGAGCGTVFALSPPAEAKAQWGYTKLYDFQAGQDGGAPAAPLTLDDAGSVYGYSSDGTWGTVFQLRPPSGAGSKWDFQILYVFTGQADGNLEAVYSPLVLDGDVLYGVASGGSSTSCGQFGCGSVFRLTPGPIGGTWSKKALFTFPGGSRSGKPSWIAGPDAQGAFYVSTALGHGAVVKISPPASGDEWTESVIARFQGGSDGRDPTNLLLTSDGVLFGLALGPRAGLVFQLTPPTGPSAGWTRTTIAAIADHRYGPNSLALGADGALIGTVEGDFDFFAGSVFKLTPPKAGGAWTYTELWNFNRGPDRNPLNVVRGRGGHLFGVLNGGDSSDGSIFELR